jgi:hypothetical protein
MTHRRAARRPSILLLSALAFSCALDDESGEAEVEAEDGAVARLGPAPTSNSCADVGWADTLRCKSLAAAGFPAAQPQPNYTDAPATVAEIRHFTRVFLDIDDTVRCYDGTIPAIYVDAASPPSDKWIISMTGGGSCVPVEGATPGVLDDASDCTETYEGERTEMGTATEPPMKNFNGINSPGAVANPVFSGYNRVRVEKCSYDRYNGRATFEDVQGDFLGVPLVYDAYQQGYPIMVAALDALLPGLTFDTWSDGGGGPTDVVTSSETLPALADADTILFVGHSGGAHGLMHNIDALADELTAQGVTADVRAVFDANFSPSTENEAVFANAVGGGAPLGGDLFSGDLAGESIADGAVAGTPFTYDLAAYYTDPATSYVEAYDNWQAEFDQSCLDAHATTGDDWICRDRHHVLFNHVSTPMFVRQDFSDPNKGHTNSGVGFGVAWGSAQAGAALCSWFAVDPCPPLLSVAQYQDRIAVQAQTLISDYWSAWEGAAADPTITVGARPTMYLWMPDCGSHAGAYNNDHFFDTEVTYKTYVHSMRQWLEGFMSVPAQNRKGWRVDGWTDGVDTMATVCP